MTLLNRLCKHGKKFALLIDPDKYSVPSLMATLYAADEINTDIILVGGSLVSDSARDHKKMYQYPRIALSGFINATE